MTLGLIRRPERGLAPLGDRKPGVCSQRLLSAKKVGRAGDHPLALNIAERWGSGKCEGRRNRKHATGKRSRCPAHPASRLSCLPEPVQTCDSVAGPQLDGRVALQDVLQVLDWS